MTEYIEREALQTALMRKRCGVANQRYTEGWNDCLLRVKSMVSKAHAIDVAPVVHGDWLLRHIGTGHYWECSVCHTNPCIYVTEHTKFCPNCGARMDGDDDAKAD